MRKEFFVSAILFMALFTVACKKYAIDPGTSPGITPAVPLAVPLIPLVELWRDKANYPGGGRYHAFSFTLLNKGYFGGGNNRDYLFPKFDFWAYDPGTDVWTQKADVPNRSAVGAAAFVLNNMGYISTGFTHNDTYLHFNSTSETWMYNPTTNTWTAKADFPGGTRGGAVGMTIDGKGYVGTGAFHNNLLTGDTFYKDWWQYNASTNTWTRKADFPGTARAYAAGSGLFTSGYMGGGTNSIITTGANYGDWYQYNSITDTWTLKFTKAFSTRNSAVAITSGKKIYLGTGTTGDPLYGGASLAKKDMLEYNPLTNAWTTLSDLQDTRSGAAGFSIDNAIYVGTGFTPSFRALTVR